MKLFHYRVALNEEERRNKKIHYAIPITSMARSPRPIRRHCRCLATSLPSSQHCSLGITSFTTSLYFFTCFIFVLIPNFTLFSCFLFKCLFSFPFSICSSVLSIWFLASKILLYHWFIFQTHFICFFLQN